MSRVFFHGGEDTGHLFGVGQGGCEALEVESGVEEDAAVACRGGAEESAGKGLRFAEERASERAIGRGEVLAIHHVLREDGKREAVLARNGRIQPSRTALIAA